jgi:hypothetical protein
MITYQDLINDLQKMTPEQRRMNVTFYLNDTDEYVPGYDDILDFTVGCDVLDDTHPVFIVDA